MEIKRIQQEIKKIQGKLLPYFATIKKYYYVLPQKNRRALSILVPLFILLLLIPIPEKKIETTKDQQRIEVVLDNTQPQQSIQNPPQKKVVKNIEKTEIKVAKKDPISTQWQRYQIKKGDSLIKIFRSNNIPATDLYAVAAIEGEDKPVSRIHPGQWVQYKQQKDGGLDALIIEMDDDKSVMYFRLSSGDFVRDKE